MSTPTQRCPRPLRPGPLLALLTLLVATGPLAGCATAARSPAMTARASTVSGIAVPATLHRNIAVGAVSGGHDTNPLWMSKVGNAEFEHALRDSLAAAGMLAEGPGPGDYVLLTDLQRLKQPVFGFNMKVTAVVGYQLRERSSGMPVFQTEVTTPYTAEMSEAFLGVERLKLANEGAIRTNIERLIQELVESFRAIATP